MIAAWIIAAAIECASASIELVFTCRRDAAAAAAAGVGGGGGAQIPLHAAHQLIVNDLSDGDDDAVAEEETV